MDRSTSLQAPPGARRVPLLVVLGVLAVASLALLVGVTGGWLAAMLVPVLLLTVYILASVLRGLRREAHKREGEK